MSQHTLHSRYYTDPAFYEFDKEQIFYRTWQYVGHVSDIAKVGDFFTTKVADESLLIVRGEDQQVRAFYNVCRHRAHLLASGRGNRRFLACPYHAWTYRLNGQLHRAPNTDNVAGFCKDGIKLREVRLEQMLGLMFVNLDDDAPSLAETYPGMVEKLSSLRDNMEEMQVVFETVIEHECNWKISIENYSECYHCPGVHKFLSNDLYDVDSYTCDSSDAVTLHFLERKHDRELHGDMYSWHLWPNAIIEMFPMYGSVSLRKIEPVGPKKTVYSYNWYLPPNSPQDVVDEVVAIGRQYCELVGPEDAAVVEAVQTGLESRSYESGPLVVTPTATQESENAVAHFQSRYAAVLEAAGQTP